MQCSSGCSLPILATVIWLPLLLKLPISLPLLPTFFLLPFDILFVASPVMAAKILPQNLVVETTTYFATDSMGQGQLVWQT